MSLDVGRKLIHAVLATGDLSSVQTAGISVDWLDDVQEKRALQAIMEYASATDTIGQVPGTSYLVRRMAMVPGAYDGSETVPQLVEAMKSYRMGRLLSLAMQEASSLNSSDPMGAYSKLMAALTSRDIESLRSRGREQSLQDLVPEIFQHYMDSISAQGITGVPTPFAALTHSTKGWQRGDMYCLYASKKSFKSWIMLLFMIVALRSCEGHVLFVTSEMPPAQLGVRLLCLLNGWNFNDYRDRKIGIRTVVKMLSQDGRDRIHFYQPTGFDEQAVAEVRGQIKRLNLMGGVSLVLWDGHYRSASKQEWEFIYNLTRKTRALALEPEILRPPIIVATQEGSTKGQATHAVYGQEASLMLYGTKTGPSRLLMQTTAVREGPSVEMEVEVDLKRSLITQVSSKSEVGEAQGAGGLV